MKTQMYRQSSSSMGLSAAIISAATLVGCASVQGGGGDPTTECNSATATSDQDKCSPPEPPPAPSCVAGKDDDEDGLDNCEELSLGTALHLSDTDGDGFSDYHEVVELGFQPDNNRYKFNPRIADTPRIRINITSAPQIDLLYNSSTGVERSHSVERSQESSQRVTSSTTSTQSHAVEWSLSTGASITSGYQIGFPKLSFQGKQEATVSYETSVATTQEVSMAWTQEQSEEHSQGLAEAQAMAESEETSIHGGRLAVSVDIINGGDIAFTLKNVLLSAFMSTPGGEEILVPVGGLSFDTTQVAFPALTYAPGQLNGPFIFRNPALPTGIVEDLLTDSSNLEVRVVGYELTDENDRSFTHDQTEVAAKTATVLIDYAGADLSRVPERYAVATNADGDTLRITASQALGEVLAIPYGVSETGSLVKVRDIENDPDIRGYWAVVHKSTDGVEELIDLQRGDNAGHRFDEIELKSGDVLHLVYYADADGDGLGTRQEAAYGTDPLLADTDDDGLDDGEEVNDTKTSPLLADTDGDCLSDSEELKGSNTSPFEPNIGVCEGFGDPVVRSWERRHMRYSNIRISGEKRSVYFAAPGESVTVELNWNENTDGGTIYCPYCIVQFYLGIRDVFSSCLTSRTFPPDSNASASLAHTFDAPAEPGVYYLTQEHSLQYECVNKNHNENPGRAIATLVVLP